MNGAESIPINVLVHPPERRLPRAGPPAQAGHCCCCCCCLHSLGALIGAAVAPAIGRGPQRSYLPITHYWEEEDDYDDYDSRERRPRAPDIALPKSGPSAVALFWWILLGLVVFGTLMSVVSGPDGLFVGWIIMLLVLPLVQLGSAVVVCIVLGVSDRSDKRYQFIQLGKIALGLVIGTLAGIAAMFIIYFALSR